jgi:hypothetical protein
MAFFVGALLGVVFSVLGAGGGILAVPVLLVVFKTSMAEATGAGLAVVWVAAVAGALSHGRAGRVDVRTALIFGVPSVLGAVAGAKLHVLVPERVTVGLFSLVLIAALAAMFRQKVETTSGVVASWKVVTAGLATGVLTGFLGVGAPAPASRGHLDGRHRHEQSVWRGGAPDGGPRSARAGGADGRGGHRGSSRGQSPGGATPRAPAQTGVRAARARGGRGHGGQGARPDLERSDARIVCWSGRLSSIDLNVRSHHAARDLLR